MRRSRQRDGAHLPSLRPVATSMRTKHRLPDDRRPDPGERAVGGHKLANLAQLQTLDSLTAEAATAPVDTSAGVDPDRGRSGTPRPARSYRPDLVGGSPRPRIESHRAGAVALQAVEHN